MRVTVLSVLVLALLVVAGVEAAQDGSLRSKLMRLASGAGAPRPMFQCNTQSSSGGWSLCNGYCVQMAASEASSINGFEKGTCVQSKPPHDGRVEVARRPYKCSNGCGAKQCCMPPEFVKINAITNEGVCDACPTSQPALPADWRKTSSCYRGGVGMFACGADCCDYTGEEKYCLVQGDPLKRSCVKLDRKGYAATKPLVFAKYSGDAQTLQTLTIPANWKQGSDCASGSACGTECCANGSGTVCIASRVNPLQRSCVKNGQPDVLNCKPLWTNNGMNQLPYCGKY